MKSPARGETDTSAAFLRLQFPSKAERTDQRLFAADTVYLGRTSEVLDLHLDVPDPAMHLLR